MVQSEYCVQIIAETSATKSAKHVCEDRAQRLCNSIWGRTKASDRPKQQAERVRVQHAEGRVSIPTQICWNRTAMSCDVSIFLEGG